MLQVLCLLNGPIEENCYVLHREGALEAILIDPGSSPEQLREVMDKAGLKPVLILATHGHFDHVGAAQALAEAYGAPFACHEADVPMLDFLEDQFAFYGMGSTKKPVVSRTLKHGEFIEAAGLKLKVLHTPGHTPGGLCFYEAGSGSLFSGDTLFRRSIGRSDFEGGNHAQLVSSIRSQLLSLPGQTKVYPGHGEASSIAEEKDENGFLQA
jgi:glyoxylase-like metal-dependent hydrolase (beta-lactamase superfamily II)